MHKDAIAQAWRPWKYPDGESSLLRLPAEGPSGDRLWLRPVAASLPALLEADAERIAAWRNRNREAFFTWTSLTALEALHWLRESYAGNGADLLFMVETSESHPFGHMALYNVDMAQAACEFGRVIRGEPTPFPGAMTIATQALLLWALGLLPLQKVFLEVFETNRRAVALYRRCGFGVTERFGLYRRQKDDTICWSKLSEGRSSPDAYGLRMEVTANTLIVSSGRRP